MTPGRILEIVVVVVVVAAVEVVVVDVLPGSSVDSEELHAQLAQELQEGHRVLLHIISESPGIDSGGRQTPGVDRPPPLLFPNPDSVAGQA